MDVHSDLESDIMVSDAMPKQAALDIKSQVIKAIQIQEGTSVNFYQPASMLLLISVFICI